MPRPLEPIVSVVFPAYFPDMRTKEMSDANLLYAQSTSPEETEWVIIETGSTYYVNHADIYIHEKERTHPDISVDRGFQIANGKYVVFLANDVKVCNNWIEKMLECFHRHSDCGLASLGNNEHNDEVKDEITEGMYFSVCMMRREDAWFDLSYPFNFADTDLVFRLHLEGKKCYKNLSGSIYHEKHATCGNYCGDLDKYNESREYFMKKYKDHKDDELFKLYSQELRHDRNMDRRTSSVVALDARQLSRRNA